MKKSKINSKIAKKVVLYGLLALLVFFLGYSIVTSYTVKNHITTNSTELSDEIPVGEYLKYIKNLEELYIKHDTDDIDSVDLYDGSSNSNIYLQRLEGLKNTNTSIIEIDGNDGVVVDDINTEAVQGWPVPNTLDYEKYAQYLNGDTGYYTSENGTITYTTDQVEKTGLYYLRVSYFIPAGKGSNVQRSLLINGKTLFSDLASLTFYRLYTDAESERQEGKYFIEDIYGNDIKPSQAEVFEYRQTFIKDETGYVTEPYLIYLKGADGGEAVTNTISFKGIRDCLVITKIEICPTSEYQMPTYQEYYDNLVSQTGKTKDSVTNVLEKIEVEDPTVRVSSSPTLYPIADRTNATNYPSDPVKTKYNAVGGSKWSTPGEYIGWKVNAPESGFYRVAFRAKQDLSRGLFTTRKLLIDGVQPFNEAANARFYYNSEYNIVTIGNSEGEAYYIYLEQGEHVIALQASLGEYGSAISEVQEVINDLNALYLKIIAITTANPDDYADYKLYGENNRLNSSDPEYMQKIFSKAAIALNEVSKYITELTGEKSSLNNTLDKLVLQIGGVVDANGDGVAEDVKGFATNPRNVTKELATFKSNLSSLGTWILDIKNQSLTIESMFLYTEDMTDELPRANDNFFQGLWFKTSGFVQSFWFDYESIGVTQKEGFDREIEVWFLTSADSGREQANVVKSLIDQNFIYDKTNYKDYECNVILKILAPGVLLPATLAGTGPDVAINVDGGLPVNYALRGAIYNLKTFDDYDEVIADRFTSQQMIPFEFNGGVYGLPNTVSYLVMFYRTDIFDENGWEVPKTWDDVINLVTELQVSNLDFYLPLEGAGSQIYATILYQMGGRFYTDNYTACDFSTEVAKKAFEQWVSYFSDYSFELAANFSNRFRSGEMPIGISSFTLYNTLAVFAPDIAGKWDFAPIPGTVREDGTVDNRGAIASTASVILGNTSDPESSWAFLKFWTETNTQISFANEIESILGSGARHNTANINAMKQMSWSQKELDVLIPAFEKAFGVPEVAGGYYISRNLENAIREVINNDSNPRETLEEYVELINGEITRKRSEFGLPLE